MNEQLLHFWNRSKKHLDRIMIGSFLVMTIAIVYFFLQERNLSLGDALVTPTTWQPQEVVTPQMEDFLTSFTQPVRPFEASRAVVIMVQNPWELRTARDQEQVEQEALRLHNDARRAFGQGNLREAERLALLARANKPNFRENDELLAQIAAGLVAGATPTPSAP